MYRRVVFFVLILTWTVALHGAVPVTITPVTAQHGIVVAGHPQAAEAGLAVLKAGGNAVDAAVATSFALGIAEPYASGVGGKLVLLYYEASSHRVYVVDAMDAAGSIDVAAYRRRPSAGRTQGYGAVAVPGLVAGLWTAHQRWGHKPWADDAAPAIALARDGVRVLPKTRDFFEEQLKKLTRGDAEIARIFLPKGALPDVGAVLRNPDLVLTLEQIAQHGRDGFYRGPVAEKLVAAFRAHDSAITADDLARYEPRVAEPVSIAFAGCTVFAPPPPTSGSAMLLPALKALEGEFADTSHPLRSSDTLTLFGEVWRRVEQPAYDMIGDSPDSLAKLHRALSPAAIEGLRKSSLEAVSHAEKAAAFISAPEEALMASTTHFIVVDADGNVVCATQSLSTHFGAGVVPPGTGVVLNDSMSNFDYEHPSNPGFVAPGRRPRSTVCPTLVLKDGRPVLALGVPGSATIPSTLLQVLLDRFEWHRPLAEAIGDARFHFKPRWKRGDTDLMETEVPLSPDVASALQEHGWTPKAFGPAGRGRHFAGLNAVEFETNGTLSGYADPRRTNAAVGY